jgi:hypothetical protein
MVLLLWLAVMALQMPRAVPDAYGQQSPQGYSRPTHTPQTYTPQTYSPQGYSPKGYTPQINSAETQPARPAPRTRLFHCVTDEDTNKHCAFYSARDLRSGNPCTCDGSQGSIY